MLVNLVFIRVKSERIDDFIQASLVNAAASRKEPGVSRFDVVREATDPSRFILIEVFRDEAAPAKHKETAHYKTWKEAVESMLAEERRTIRCASVSF